MGTTSCVVDDSGAEVERVVVVLAGGDRDGCFVATKDDRHEHCAVGLRILCDDVLRRFNEYQERILVERGTYTLFPGPVARHEVTVNPLAVGPLKVAKWSLMEVVLEIGVAELDMGERSDVARPNVEFLIHPGRSVASRRTWAIILDGETTPRCVALLD